MPTRSSVEGVCLPPVLGMILLLFVAGLEAQTAQPKPSGASTSQPSGLEPSPGHALLARGTLLGTGLPFFGANALRRLYGEYILAAKGSAADGVLRVPVWFCRENIVFGGQWKRGDYAGMTAWRLARAETSSASPNTGYVLGLKLESYCLFLELPGDSPSLRAFVLSFVARFQTFFRNAANDAELSFPASVDY